jgi:hypothetical protein
MSQKVSLQFCGGNLEGPDLQDFLGRHGYYDIATAEGGEGLMNLDAIQHEKFVLLVEHSFVASTDPSA